jgi:hypothetical protein
LIFSLSPSDHFTKSTPFCPPVGERYTGIPAKKSAILLAFSGKSFILCNLQFAPKAVQTGAFQAECRRDKPALVPLEPWMLEPGMH